MDVEKGDGLHSDDDTVSETTSTPLIRRDFVDFAQFTPRRYFAWLHWILHIICVISIVILTYLAGNDSNLKCWDRFNSYTPMRDFVSRHPYIDYPINGSKHYQSDFVGAASQTKEDAWREATRYGLLSLTKDELVKVGYPEWSAHFPSSAREDEDFPVVVIGNHQLHCLHYIWQDHHLDFYTSRAKFRDKHRTLYEAHYEHCIDFLRQHLMCHFDMSVTPYQWVKGKSAPMPGAITNEKCVDWDAMTEWMKVNFPETPKDFMWQLPEDAVLLNPEP